MIYDTIIIGSGPSGLSAYIYGKQAEMEILMIDANPQMSGTVATSFNVDNYLGFEKISGMDLAEKFKNHALSYGDNFLAAAVEKIQKCNNTFTVFTNKGKYQSKTVIVATGASHRHLGVAGEEEFFGRGVSYCAVCDGNFFKNKTTSVVGGGNTAFENALYLSDLCKNVYLIHRRDEFRADKSLIRALKLRKNVKFFTNCNVAAIKGDTKVFSITLKNNDKIFDVLTDGVFISVGIIPNSRIIGNLAETDSGGFIKADETGKTSTHGLLAIGDVRTTPLRQICTAVSDGANAVHSIKNILYV